MKQILGISSAIALMALAAPATMASTITIDDFSVPGGNISDLQGNAATDDVTGATSNIIGGTRSMWVSTDAASNQFGTSFSVQDDGLDQLNFANGPGNTGQGLLVYDGGDNTGGSDFNFAFDSVTQAADGGTVKVDTDGLGGIDLLGSGTLANTFFTFSADNFDENDGTAHFWAYAWDTDGDLVKYYELLQATSFDEKLLLGAFSLDGLVSTNDGQGTFNWDSIGALAFSIESNTVPAQGGNPAITGGFDATLNSITVNVVPLPASALLLLGGLGGLAGVSARRRRKSA